MIRASLTPAAGTLEALAPRCREGGQLRALAQALRDYHASADSETARAWAGVDLHAAFLNEDPGLPEPEKNARRWGWVDTAIQPLVFVPIFLTWLGLALAAFVARPGESLLQTWETGSVPGFALRDVALYTTVIIVALIGLTAVLAVRRRRLDQEDGRLRRELAEALTAAGLELSPLRIGITKRLARELDKAAGSLADSADAIGSAGQAATTAAAAVIPALADVRTAAEASRDAAAELGTVPTRLALHLDQITEAAGGIADADQNLVTSVDGAAKQLADSVTESTNGLAGTLQDGVGEIRAALGDLSVTAAGYASRTEVASDVLGLTHQALAALPEAVESLQAGISGVGGQLTELTAAVKSMQEASALLLQAISAQRDETPPEPAQPVPPSKNLRFPTKER